MALQWTIEAIEDFQEVSRFLAGAGAEKWRLQEVNRAILTKAKWISTRPKLGSPVEDTKFRVTYALDFRYGIYYQELRSNLIRVLAIRHTSQERPTADELAAREQS